MVAILTKVKWYLMVFINISLKVSDSASFSHVCSFFLSAFKNIYSGLLFPTFGYLVLGIPYIFWLFDPS